MVGAVIDHITFAVFDHYVGVVCLVGEFKCIGAGIIAVGRCDVAESNFHFNLCNDALYNKGCACCGIVEIGVVIAKCNECVFTKDELDVGCSCL